MADDGRMDHLGMEMPPSTLRKPKSVIAKNVIFNRRERPRRRGRRISQRASVHRFDPSAD